MDAVKDAPEQACLAREILNSALSGSLLTRRLMAVARNQPLHPQRVDLNALLQDHVEMLRRTLGETIHIDTQQAPALWFTSADPSQIRDALLNLALNARDAMPQGGSLTIQAASHPGGCEAILLVDDNETLMAVARRHLVTLGYKVVCAASGPAALAILESGEAVDLLFTDIVMPEGMSGYQLAEAARRLRPGLKVLFTSGYAAELSEHDGRHMLRKPYDRRELSRAVRTALDALVESA